MRCRRILTPPYHHCTILIRIHYFLPDSKRTQGHIDLTNFVENVVQERLQTPGVSGINVFGRYAMRLWIDP
jgi:multidrug efflux pump subunit AcrB